MNNLNSAERITEDLIVIMLVTLPFFALISTVSYFMVENLMKSFIVGGASTILLWMVIGIVTFLGRK